MPPETLSAAVAPPATAPDGFALRSSRFLLNQWAERGIVTVLFLAASVAALATAAIFWTMADNGWDFLRMVSLREFLLGKTWAPDFAPERYGIRPLMTGTLK